MAKRSWWVPPRANQFHVVEYRARPITHWFQTWVTLLRNKTTGELVEERCISIKLPIWGYYYAINIDEDRWGQLTFQYRGVRGCFLGPVFPPEVNLG